MPSGGTQLANAVVATKCGGEATAVAIDWATTERASSSAGRHAAIAFSQHGHCDRSRPRENYLQRMYFLTQCNYSLGLPSLIPEELRLAAQLAQTASARVVTLPFPKT